jgi:hypothetical protein
MPAEFAEKAQICCVFGARREIINLRPLLLVDRHLMGAGPTAGIY